MVGINGLVLECVMVGYGIKTVVVVIKNMSKALLHIIEYQCGHGYRIRNC